MTETMMNKDALHLQHENAMLCTGAPLPLHYLQQKSLAHSSTQICKVDELLAKASCQG